MTLMSGINEQPNTFAHDHAGLHQGHVGDAGSDPTCRAEIETIAAALAYIPAHDRQLWVHIGMAIKSALGEDGFGRAGALPARAAPA